MTTSIFRTQADAKQEMMRRMEGDLTDLRRLVLRRHGSGYAVDYQNETLPLALGPSLIPGVEIAGLPGTNPVHSGHPISAGIGGEGAREEPGSRPIITSGGSRGTPETETGIPISSAPPEIGYAPFEITVMVFVHDFQSEHIAAKIESDPGQHLQHQVTIETHDLAMDEWSTLMECAREKQPVLLAVRLIVASGHRVHRSRVVATRVIGATQSVQPSLFTNLW